MRRSITLLGVVALLCGCQDARQTNTGDSQIPRPVPAENVLARFSDGEISAADVDAYILQMPADERPAPGADLNAWYAELIRTLAVDHRLLNDAQDAGLQHSKEFELRRTASDRQLSVQSCLAGWKPGLDDISSDDIRAAYEARADQFQAPERRSVYHIYRRLDAGQDISALETGMVALRDRILRGENFQRLARSESDSESRHRQGSIGWVARGQLPAAFEELVFSLDEGVPSRPLAAPDGVHLFQVDDILPERQLSLQEAAPVLRQQLEAAAIDAALDQISTMNTSPSVEIIDRVTLERLIEQRAEQDPVLIAKDHTLSLEELRLRLGRVMGEQAVAGNGGPARLSNDLAWKFLNRIYRHETVYEYCAREGLIAEDAVARLMADWETRALVNRMRQQRLRERVTADSDRLELYYQSNIGQYTPPVQWKLRRLLIPFEDANQAKTLMARLEDLAATNAVGLEAVQDNLGGELQELDWTTLHQMGRINPKLPQLVSPLDNEALAAPLHVADGLALFQVLGRREFEPRPFDEVKDEVAAAYLRQYTSDVYEGLEADILDGIRFELFPDRLDALRQAGLPRPGDSDSPEVTVEQLDALLSGS
ncbi:MAG: peptidyl-prolyl cis-trans isomerase [Wenzhouxiangellaceae bacterium]